MRIDITLVILVFTSWDQVLQSGDFSLRQLDLSAFWVGELATLLDEISSSNINDFVVLLFGAHDLLLFLLQQLLHVLLFERLLKLGVCKNIWKLAVVDDSLVLVNQVDIWKSVVKTYDHVIDFILQFLTVFVLNLTFCNHRLDERIPIVKQEILGSSHLNGFSNFWEHVFNVFHDVDFCLLDVFFAFVQDLAYKVLIFNNFSYLLVCFFVSIDKVDDDIISKRQVSINHILEIVS